MTRNTFPLPPKYGLASSVTLDPKCLDALRAGQLAILPTETVYGVCADATDADAVAEIYRAKGRPSHNPLIAHVCDIAMAERYGVFDERARTLAEHFWPGPLTLVLPAKENTQTPLAPAVGAGLPTLAVRWPEGPIAEAARALGRPVAAPSANLSGQVSATRLADIQADFPNIPAMDGCVLSVGLESTIARVDNDTITILRPGAVLAEDLAAIVPGTLVHEAAANTAIQAPGMMASHYAPRAKVRLNAMSPERDEAYLAFGAPPESVGEAPLFQLSETGDLGEAARNLYTGLHTLDAKNPGTIAVAPIPNTGLGIAINDRLKRAAAPRPANDQESA